MSAYVKKKPKFSGTSWHDFASRQTEILEKSTREFKYCKLQLISFMTYKTRSESYMCVPEIQS
jgi:hypothetical protein